MLKSVKVLKDLFSTWLHSVTMELPSMQQPHITFLNSAQWSWSRQKGADSVTGVRHLNGRDLWPCVMTCCLQSVYSIVTGWALTGNTFWGYNNTHKHTGNKGENTLGHVIVHFIVWINRMCASVLLFLCVYVIQGALCQSRLKATSGWEGLFLLMLKLLLILPLFV